LGTDIHNTAVVDSRACIGEKVKIGPFAVIEAGAEIGSRTEIHPNAVIRNGTKIGEDCKIYSGAILGGEPQDVKFKGEESYLTIGNGTVIRECVTAHRGSGEFSATMIGAGCMLMANTHVGHNCVVGDRVTMANLATLGGFSQVGEGAFVGGITGLHQFVRVGAYVMVGGGSVLLEDVPPYMLVTGGHRPAVCGLNRIGLVRAGFSEESRRALHKAYRILYKQGLTAVAAAAKMKEELSGVEEVRVLIEFLEAKTDRGISKGR
jgi:UDP-N-acetylglucosamine acyltransferase